MASTINDVEQGVQDTLNGLIKDFYSSLTGGASKLDSFISSWTSFDNEVRHYRHKLQADTLKAVYTFATTVATITSGLLDLEDVRNKLRDQLSSDISRILHKPMSELTIADHHLPQSEPIKPSLSPYIKPSYTWLLANLHNPYPSREIRRKISGETNVSMKDIDAWFTDIRKRIGWNELRTAHFATRSELIAAATRFFKGSPEVLNHGPLTTPYSEVSQKRDFDAEFVQMEDRARKLYSGQFVETPLAAKLDIAVKESTPELDYEDDSDARHCQAARSRNDNHLVHHQTSYPSPEPSPNNSPEPPSPIAPRISLDTGVVLNRKRRFSSSGPSDIEDGQAQARLRKRTRLESPHVLAIASLPSPAPSLPDIPQSIPGTPQSVLDAPSELTLSLELPTASLSSLNVVRKRKRRLSESNEPGPSKRPHNMSSIPRLQTVSDPLPLVKRAFEEPSFDEWFQDNFQAVSAIGDDIPPPVIAEVSLESTTLDVDVYQYDCFPYLPGIRSTPSPPAAPEHPASSFPLELPASTEKHANVSELDYLTITNGLLGQGITEQPGAEEFSLNFDLGSFVEPYSDTSLFATHMGREVNQDLNFDFKSSSFPLDLQQWMEPFQGYDAPGLLFNESVGPSTLGDSNSEACIPRVSQHTADVSSKLERVQLLRDELRRLEADITS